MTNNILKKAETCEVLEEEFLKELIEYNSYGSLGTLNWVIDILQIIRKRILFGEKIKQEKTGEFLTVESFYKLVEDNFVGYIFKNLEN